MNEFVSCLLDGDYWNTYGPRRKASQRFQVNDVRISLSHRSRRPSQPLTPEQRARSKEASDRRRSEELERRAQEEQRILARKKIEEEGVLLFDDRILLGGENVAADIALLEKHNVKAILNVTERVPNFHEESGKFKYKRIYVLDTNEQEIVSKFGEAAEFVGSHLAEAGARVLIHCKQGRSRSPSFVLAYAMKALGHSLRDAWAKLCAAASEEHFNINSNFQRQLMNYEYRLYQRISHDFLARERRQVELFSPTKGPKQQQSRRRSQPRASTPKDDAAEMEKDEAEPMEEREEDMAVGEDEQSIEKQRDDDGMEADENGISFESPESEDDEDGNEEREGDGMDVVDTVLHLKSTSHAAPQPSSEGARRDEKPSPKRKLMNDGTDAAEEPPQKRARYEDAAATEKTTVASPKPAAIADGAAVASASAWSPSALLSRIDEANAATLEALERAYLAERKLMEERHLRLSLEKRLYELEQALAARGQEDLPHVPAPSS